MKIITTNKDAYHNYFILETYEAGIKLQGAEVKSIRQGNVSLKDSFISISKLGQMYVKNMYIKPYDNKDATFKNKERADRILLMHKMQITKLFSKVKEKGLTLVPTKIYFEGSLVKIEVALCQGKHNYDKKRVLKEKDIKRETLRQLKRI